VEGSCELGNKPSGSIKFREVPKWLHNCQILKVSKVRSFASFLYAPLQAIFMLT
jgi:hypothetical protein